MNNILKIKPIQIKMRIQYFSLNLKLYFISKEPEKAKMKNSKANLPLISNRSIENGS